ncbi:MAG: hypothetical protein PHT60_16055 [Acidiphilium sp.]|nr:hypothetical protein [Acidiphilium sp.]MDD4937278.1 hypothetical protein [Acidiphilium sp.]
MADPIDGLLCDKLVGLWPSATVVPMHGCQTFGWFLVKWNHKADRRRGAIFWFAQCHLKCGAVCALVDCLANIDCPVAI